MNTRKRQRVSYAEVSSDDEAREGTTFHKHGHMLSSKSRRTHDDQDCSFKGRSVYPRTKTTDRRSKRPAFNYAKILDLPTDIVISIFEQLEAPTRKLQVSSLRLPVLADLLHAAVWAIATANEGLQCLLASPECKGIWSQAFANHRIYASRYFLGDVYQPLHHHRSLEHICGPLYYYGFCESIYDGGIEQSVAFENISDADIQHYHATTQLALSAPPCPSGISEYDYAKFLYAKQCYYCSKPVGRYQTVAWEFCRRLCDQCSSKHIRSLGDLLDSKNHSAEAEDVKELLDFTEFLCYEPYGASHQNGSPPSLRARELICDGEAASELLDKFADFRERKRNTPTVEFEEINAEKARENHERCKRGRHIQEFVYLRTLYEIYLIQQVRQAAQMSKARRRSDIYRLLQQKGEFTQADLHLALQWNTAFRKLLDNKHVLSEEAGPILQARLVEYVKETKAWTAANIHWAQNKCSSDLSGAYMKALLKTDYHSRLPELSSADLWMLRPCRTLAQSAFIDEDGYPDLGVGFELQSKVWKIMEEAKFRSLIIREQLIDILLERASDPDNGVELKDTDDEGYEQWALEKLQHPASTFQCIKCKRLLSWAGIIKHPCVVQDLAHDSYESYISNKKTLCKPVGFQRERVCAPEEFAKLFKLLVTAVNNFKKGVEWRYVEFKIPETRAQSALCYGQTWLFSCTPDTCEDGKCVKSPVGFWRRSFIDMAEHLFEKMQKEKKSVDDYQVDCIRVYAGGSER